MRKGSFVIASGLAMAALFAGASSAQAKGAIA